MMMTKGPGVARYVARATFRAEPRIGEKVTRSRLGDAATAKAHQQQFSKPRSKPDVLNGGLDRDVCGLRFGRADL